MLLQLVYASTAGLVIAFSLILTGYLLGVKRGRAKRESLYLYLLEQIDKVTISKSGFTDIKEMVSALVSQNDTLISTLLKITDLLRRDHLAVKLADIAVNINAQSHAGLTSLLDDIANVGNFSEVVLSDENGLPLAVSNGVRNLDKLLMTAALVMLVADKVNRASAGPVQAVLIHNAEKETIARLFAVGPHKLLLTASAVGTALTATALDAALAKIERVLTQQLTGV
jgi:hypothetical protein